MSLRRIFDSASTTITLLALAAYDIDVLAIKRTFRSLDSYFTYSVAEARVLFESLGAEGREIYFAQEVLDLTFIATYTLLAIKAARWIYARQNKKVPAWILTLCFAPGFFDVIETTGIMFELKTWPQIASGGLQTFDG